MQTLLQNLRFSLRMLARNPGMTITVLLTLALGIGANTAIFTVDYATLLAPLPYPEPNQLVIVWSRIQNFHNGVAAGDFLDWKQQNTVFQDVCASTGNAYNLATKDQPEFVIASVESPCREKIIGKPLFMGRYFLEEEGEVGHDRVVILTHKLWVKLGADPHIVGSTLRLNGDPYTVVGVEQEGPDAHGGQVQMMVPLAFKPE
ncbi:MAG: ABC transporter permease, partial [Candidatus Sulfotelmatobacter sp.]